MRRLFNSLLALMLGSSLWLAGTPAPVYANALLSAPRQQTQSTEPIYALQGTLGKVENQNFDTYLVTTDGKAYALVGETPQVDQQIVTLRDQAPSVSVKVWGTLYPQGRVSTTPEIVVSGILASDGSAAPTPVPQPSQPTATVINVSINVRSGPSTNYPVMGGLQQGQSCTIIGRDAASTWWELQCPGGLQGWVLGQLVNATGNAGAVSVVDVPPPPAPPTPAPPTVFNGWKASYFANRDLAGAPAVVADVPDINFNWGNGSPDPSVPPDNFSTRFERTINFNPGTYRFSARADDGVRVFIDNQPVIDQWHEGSGNVEYTADRSMYGNQSVRVEHYEASGLASLAFSFTLLANTTIDGGGSGDWAAQYYNNPDLSGNPLLVRREPRQPYPLDQDWGNGSPAPGVINDDNWSARWVGTFSFDSGDYMFQARTDDGVRVYIDGIRVIDAWSDGFKQPSNQFKQLGAGNHQITIEYYERGGTAFNRVWWWRVTGNSGGGGSSDHSNRDQ
jgi:uncharacterized protein YraI